MRLPSLSSIALVTAALLHIAFAGEKTSKNAFLEPNGISLDTTWPVVVKWQPDTKGTVTITLLKGKAPDGLTEYETIANKIKNTGTFTWATETWLEDSSTVEEGNKYGLKIIDDDTGDYNLSPQFDLVVPHSTYKHQEVRRYYTDNYSHDDNCDGGDGSEDCGDDGDGDGDDDDGDDNDDDDDDDDGNYGGSGDDDDDDDDNDDDDDDDDDDGSKYCDDGDYNGGGDCERYSTTRNDTYTNPHGGPPPGKPVKGVKAESDKVPQAAAANPKSVQKSTKSKSKKSLSSGAKIGIAVVVIAIVVILALAAAFYFVRKHKKTQTQKQKFRIGYNEVGGFIEEARASKIYGTAPQMAQYTPRASVETKYDPHSGQGLPVVGSTPRPSIETKYDPPPQQTVSTLYDPPKPKQHPEI